MQTFLPHGSFHMCAKSLDNKRLNKQRVECKQIYNALTNPDARGWVNHPAVKMWRGYENALLRYMKCIHLECGERGIADNVLTDKWIEERIPRHKFTLPPWFADELTFMKIRDTHRSALVKKLPEHYASQFPDAPPFTAYFWPVM